MPRYNTAFPAGPDDLFVRHDLFDHWLEINRKLKGIDTKPNPGLDKYIKQLEATTAPIPTQEDLRYVRGFEGKWNSNWGTLEFRVNGTKVQGNYTHDNGKIEATLSADGKNMEGMWSEAPSYKPPKDRETQLSGESRTDISFLSSPTGKTGSFVVTRFVNRSGESAYIFAEGQDSF